MHDQLRLSGLTLGTICALQSLPQCGLKESRLTLVYCNLATRALASKICRTQSLSSSYLCCILQVRTPNATRLVLFLLYPSLNMAGNRPTQRAAIRMNPLMPVDPDPDTMLYLRVERPEIHDIVLSGPVNEPCNKASLSQFNANPPVSFII